MHTVFSRREWACLKEGNNVLQELSIGRLCLFGEEDYVLTRESRKDCRRNSM